MSADNPRVMFEWAKLITRKHSVGLTQEEEARLTKLADEVRQLSLRPAAVDSNVPLPCPFCGHQPDLDNSDTLHPNGTGWEEWKGMRRYVESRNVPKEQWCYSMNCCTCCGGCGVEAHGDSKEEALRNWNKRV